MLKRWIKKCLNSINIDLDTEINKGIYSDIKKKL